MALLVAACYQPPVLSPSKPLRCTTPDASGECPDGYRCVAGVCALRSCRSDVECPTGLACHPDRGCVIPGGPEDADGGAADLVIPGLGVDVRGGDAPDVDAGGAEGARPSDAPASVDGGQD